MNEYTIIRNIIIVVFIALSFRLLQLQVFSEHYAVEARHNVIDKVETQTVRGLILDRNDEILVKNKPVFDLSIIPKLLLEEQKEELCRVLNMSEADFKQRLDKAKQFSWRKPSVFVEGLSIEELNVIIDEIGGFSCLTIIPKFIRHYPHRHIAHVLGYIGQIDAKSLEKDTLKYYTQGNLVGKSGLERYYESSLRGKKGINYVLRDVNNIIKSRFQSGKFDQTLEEGYVLKTSIDLSLQKYLESLMAGFRGAAVAIEPETGGILAICSVPNYNPNLLPGDSHENSKNYRMLKLNPNLPLFNRAVMSTYPPGSTFKTIISLIGLNHKILDTVHTRFSCNKRLVACHNHPSPLDLEGAIKHSCNPYFYQAFRKIIVGKGDKSMIEKSREGLQHFSEDLKKLGLGQRLGIDIPFEARGIIPSVELYDQSYKNKRWKFSNIYSLGIGQGEIGITPLQLANLTAIIANRGWYKTPHIVSRINGEVIEAFQKKNRIDIDSVYFNFVASSMAQVVYGTAGLAKIPDIVLAGKTGTAQNPHGKDHSVFIAFAPYKDPKIAIAVYVENAGYGGLVAAPIASLAIQKYLKGKVHESRLWLEDYLRRKKEVLYPITSDSLQMEPAQ